MASCGIKESDCADMAAYPHYNRPCRGIPREIRLMIWSYSFCNEVNVSTPRNRSIAATIGLWPYVSVDRAAFNLNVFLLSKDVYREALYVARDSVTWIFPTGLMPRVMKDILSSLSPLQKQITRAIDIDAESCLTRCGCIVRDPVAESVACDHNVALLTNLLAITGLHHLSELILRAYFLHKGGTSYFNQSYPVWRYGTSQPSFTELRDWMIAQFRVCIWVNRVAQAIHRFLTDGSIAIIRFLLTGVTAHGRDYHAKPAEVLFANDIWLGYLTPSQVAGLHVQPDWVAGTDVHNLLVSLTKKATQKADAARSRTIDPHEIDTTACPQSSSHVCQPRVDISQS